MAITNSVAAQLQGVGITGVGQPGVLSAISKPTALTVTTVTTVPLSQGVLRGKVRCKVYTLDSTAKVASISLSVTDNNANSAVSYAIGALAVPSADQVAGQQTEFVQEFCVDPATAGDLIVTATAKVTGGGSIGGGGAAYWIELELVGN